MLFLRSPREFGPEATTSRSDADDTKGAANKKARRTTRRAIATAAKRRTRAIVTLSGENRHFCETKVCERESVYLTSYLDWTVSPCDDFYSFVCNHWKNLYPEVGSSIDSLLVQKVEEDIYHAMTSQARTNNRLIKTLLDVWKSTSLLLRNLGLDVLVSVKVEPDPENEERYIIALGDPDVLIGQYGSQESALPEWYSMA
ncbi:hypothetical protein MTO96_043793, partial [Rhipicephalus appendiculatus]